MIVGNGILDNGTVVTDCKKMWFQIMKLYSMKSKDNGILENEIVLYGIAR